MSQTATLAEQFVDETCKTRSTIWRGVFHGSSSFALGTAACLVFYWEMVPMQYHNLIVQISLMSAAFLGIFTEFLLKKTRFGQWLLEKLGIRNSEKTGPTNSTYMIVGIALALLTMNHYWYLAPIMFVTGAADPCARFFGLRFGRKRIPFTLKTYVGTGAASIASFLVLIPFFELRIAIILAIISAALELIEYNRCENIWQKRGRMLYSAAVILTFVGSLNIVAGGVAACMVVLLPYAYAGEYLFPDDNFRIPAGLAIAMNIIG